MSFRRIKCEFIISYDPNGDDVFSIYDNVELCKYDLMRKHQQLIFRNHGSNQIEKFHKDIFILFNLLSLDELDKIYIGKGIDNIIIKTRKDIEKIDNVEPSYIGLY